MGMSRAGRYAVVAVYAVVFCGLLPAALWWLGTALDSRFGLGFEPVWIGWPIAAAGFAMVIWSMSALWRQARALPVTALPARRLAHRGPYAIVRHPIYLGFNVLIFGAGLLLGSGGLAFVVAPLFLPLWIVYARLEERVLVRRLGSSYRHYQWRTGLLPRVPVYALSRLMVTLGLLEMRSEGPHRLPETGGFVVVANHTCYLDCVFVGFPTYRRLVYATTAEVYRRQPLRWLVRQFKTVPVRRYRIDPIACREILRYLEDGEGVVIFPEGERSSHGRLQPPLERSAGILARLPWPVYPVGIVGAYDVGPRWAGVLRRRRVVIRIGPQIDWSVAPPSETIHRALQELIEDPQHLHLEGLPRPALSRLLWRCPACLDEAGWSAADLACDSCGEHWSPTSDGRFQGTGGVPVTLADLVKPVWDQPDPGPLRCAAKGFVECEIVGPIRPLEPLGEGILELSPSGIRFGDLQIALTDIRSITTEGNTILQVATRNRMWQFRCTEGSAFRLERALCHWIDLAESCRIDRRGRIAEAA